MRAVIIQSNYIPWKGYFDLLAHADIVVLFDSVQSTKNDWRNRNAIKTAGGKSWLTIPIRHSNALRIREVEVASHNWHQKHFRSISQAYARAPHAASLLPRIGEWYARAADSVRLSEVNRVFLAGVMDLLRINTPFIEVGAIMDDAEHDRLEPTQRLVEICRRLGADAYLSGPAARDYLEEDAFTSQGIRVEWFDYNGYPEYRQLHGDFDPAVSVLDPLLMLGPAARGAVVRPIPEFPRGIET